VTRRWGWLALAGGAVVGLLLGLVYAWVIDPVEFYNTTPALLRSDYRHEWVRLAAWGYLADGDLERALARLEAVPQEDAQAALAALIETYAAQGRPAATMRTLSDLAQRLDVDTPAMLVYLATPSPQPVEGSTVPPPVTPSPSPVIVLSTPTTTPTPFLSPIPVSSPHRVVSQTLVCEGAQPQLRVLVRAAPAEDGEEDDGAAAEAEPMAGVVLWLTWPGGADRAVTGLRPQIDPGYADFTLEAGLPYALSIGEPDAPVLSNLLVQRCPTEDEPRPGSWQVVVEVRNRY
jgi:hypothetical protein